MLSKAPKRKNIIICEDVRQEPGNKVSLLGVYTDGIIFQTDSSNPEPVMLVPQLAVYATFEKLEAACSLEIKIVDPSGVVLFETPESGKMNKSDSVTMISFKILGLTFQREGSHKIEYYFDGKKVSTSFLVAVEPVQ